MTTVSSRSLTRTILFATAIAIALLAFSAARSSAAYTITDFKLTPSPLPTPAGGHPNMNYHVDPDASTAGSDDLKKVVLDFPAGLLGNPEAASPKCVATGTGTANKFASDACPSTSYIGSMLIKWKEPLGNITQAPGSVYVLSPATSGSAATIGFIVRPQGWRKIFLKTEVGGIVTVRASTESDYGLTLTVDNIPRVLTSNAGLTYPITLSDISVDINARAGGTNINSPNGAYFAFNPTRCDAATTRATINSYNTSTAIVKSSSYTPTDCANVKFQPTANVTPTVTTAGAATGVNATFGIPTADAPIQQSHVRSIQVDLPTGTGLNFPAIGAVPALCTDAQLNADACPAGAKIGTVSAVVPFLPPTMTGDVYLLTRNSSITFGYILRGANSVKAPLKGSAAAVDVDGDGGADLVRATAATMPQVPWTTATISFTSKLINNPTTACGANTVTSRLNGWSGATATLTNNWFGTVPTCTPPVVAITSPANNSSTASASTNVAFTVNGAAAIPVGTTCTVNGVATSSATTNSVAVAVGANTYAVTCANGAGSGTATVVVTRLIPPPVTITSPANNSNTTATNANVTFTVSGGSTIPAGTTCTQNGTAVASTINPAALVLGANAITVICTNGGGSSSATITVNRGVAPVVTITSPTNNSVYTGTPITVTWTATGTTPIGCTVNGAAATSPATVNLSGAYVITVACTNAFGSDSKTISFVLPLTPTVTVNAPANNSYTTAVTTSVSWTATGTNPITCTVNGTAAISPATLSLAMGANTIVVACTNVGGTASQIITVTRGTAPVVTITSPANNSPATGSTANIVYTVDGSSVLQPGTSCTINGVPSTTPPGNVVQLVSGANTIAVSCTNQYGTSAPVTIVILPPASPPTVQITSPTGYPPTNPFNVSYKVNGVASIPVGTTCTVNGSVSTSPTTNPVTRPVGTVTVNVTCTNASGPGSAVASFQPATAPLVTITAPANNSSTTAATTNVAYTVSGSTPITCTVNGSASASTTTNSVALVSGPNTITVVCTNSFGSDSRSITVTRTGPPPPDTTPPTIGPLSVTPNATPGYVTLTYSASDDSGIAPTCTPPSGSSIYLSSGTNVINVTCTDQAGNSASSSIIVNISGGGGGTLAVTINSGPPSTTPNNMPTFTWSANQPESGPYPCAPGQTCVQVIVPYVTYTCTMEGSSVPCSGNSYTPAAPLSLGGHTFCVTAHGVYSGQTSAPACLAFTVILEVPPSVSITSPTAGTSTSASSINVAYTVNGSSTIPAGTTCKVNGVSSTSTTTNAVPLVVGSNTISVACANSLQGTPATVAVTRTPASTFSPTFNQTLSGSAPGTEVDMHWSITHPPGAEAIRRIRVTQDPSIAVNFAAYGASSDMCPGSSSTTTSFSPAACPAQAKIGTVSIDAAGYASPLTGYAYLINTVPIPRIGIEVSGSIPGNPSGVSFQIVLTNSTPQVDPLCDPSTDPSGYCRTQLVTASSDISNLGITSISADFGGSVRTGVGGLLDPHPFMIDSLACDTSSTLSTSALFTGWSGASATVSDNDPLSCGAPVVAVTAPTNNSNTGASSTNVAYTVNGSPAIPAGTTCTVNGVASTSASTNTLALALGANTITVACTNASGSAADTVVVTRGMGLSVVITSPATGSNTTATTINLTYTVTPSAGATCTVNGIASTSTTTNAVPLQLGPNTITVSCSNATDSVTKAVTVNRGLAPVAVITSPANGASTNAASVNVAYTASGNALITCTVNGVASTSTTTNTVALAIGANTIAVNCTNAFGTTTVVTTITRVAGAGFAPTFNQTLSSTAPGAKVDMHWSITNPAGAEGIRKLRVSEDPSFAPNFPGYGEFIDMCLGGTGTSTSFDVANCPAQARIGSVTINAASSSTPLTGYAYLINSVPVPRIGIDVSSAIPGNPSGVAFQIILNSSVPQVDPACQVALDDVCPTHIVFTSTDIADLGITSLNADFGGSTRAGHSGPLDPHLFFIDSMACDQATSLATTALFTGWSAGANTVADNDPLNCSALPPKIQLVSPASGSWTTAASITLQYTVDPGGGGTPACTIPSGTVVSLNDGPNTVSFSCTNSTGTDSTSVQIGRDTHPPVITIVSPANGIYTNLATTQNLTYTVTDDWDTSPQCTPAQGPISSGGLNQGANVINVTCVDHAGNTSTASRVIYFDNVVPGVSANCSAQSGTSTTCTISVTEQSTLTCKVNNGAASSCASPFTTNALLVDYANSITICATDQAGNSNCVVVTVGGPPPNYVGIVQYAKPSATPGGSTNVIFAPAAGECRVDAGAFTPCTSPWTVPTSGLSSQAEHTYDIRAVGQSATPARGYIWIDSRPYNATATVTPQSNSLTTAAAVTAAGAHPDISAAVTVIGSDDPRNVSVQFPDGLMGSLRSVPVASRCTPGQATAGTCPLSSQIGTISGSMEFAHGGTTTATGAVYMVDSAGLPSQYAAGTAISMKNIPGGHGDLNVLGNLELVDASRAVRLTSTDLPRQTSNNDAFHLLSGTVTVKGDTGGAANPLITNPHFCGAFNPNRKSPGSPAFGSFAAVPGVTANNFFGTATSWEGNTTPEIQVPYVTTGCASVPFNPTITTSLSSPVAGSTTALTTNVTMPDDNSPIRTAVVKLPSFIGPNFPAFGLQSDQCSAGNYFGTSGSYITSASASGTQPAAYREFTKANCPDTARAGVATITSPLVPGTLTADVHLISSSPIPALGIDVDPTKYGNPQGVKIGIFALTNTPQVDLLCDPATSQTGDCPTQIAATISSLPDAPVSSINMTLGGMTSRELGANMLIVATPSDPACVNAGQNTTTTFTPWSGTAVQNRSQLLTPTGCDQ